ncbi:MAG: alpha-E domain-containing protein [Phycisphaerales bacterium]|nr:alpha-E domain-containing protein [Phycisphaerales bacterium]
MMGMLARAAENIYWLGRYLERSESVARMLQVTEQLSIEIRGLDPELAAGTWDDLLSIYPGSGVASPGGDDPDVIAEALTHAFLLSADNPLSVASSIRSARENARVIRDNLTMESFILLNESHLRLNQYAQHDTTDRMEMRRAVSSTRQEIFGIWGAIQQTFTRDEGLRFLDMGTVIERAYRTLMLLQIKLPRMLESPDQIDAPIYYARIRADLKTVASLENYRRTYGTELDPMQVARFLLFDRRSPHSVHVCLRMLKRQFDQLEYGSPLTNPARLLGKLDARLEFEEHEILASTALDQVCSELVDDVIEIHEAISRLYFTV